MTLNASNKKYFTALCFLFYLFSTTNAYTQISIGKTILDRKLAWSDFEGTMDKNSTFDAMTYWTVSFSYMINSFHLDTAFITFQTTPIFQNTLSWVKNDRKSDELLQHEQGHYDLAIICAEMLRQTYTSSIFLKSSYLSKTDSIFNSTMQLIKQIEVQYDADTNHMLNRDEQARWNDNIGKLLEKIPGQTRN